MKALIVSFIVLLSLPTSAQPSSFEKNLAELLISAIVWDITNDRQLESQRQMYIATQVIHGLARCEIEATCEGSVSKLTEEAEQRWERLEQCTKEAKSNVENKEAAVEACVYEASELNRWAEAQFDTASDEAAQQSEVVD